MTKPNKYDFMSNRLITLMLNIIVLACLLFYCSACKKQSTPIFKLISPKKSGIHFNNLVEETDSLNILKEQYFYNGGGVGIGDFNNDGLEDIYFTGNLVENKLYLNKGNLKFEDITEIAGVAAKNIWSSGVAIVDINADGKQDIYISATFHKDSTKRQNQLFINIGNDKNGIPKFEEKAMEYGIADDGYSTHSTFFDYDLDGDLDLYVLTNQFSNARSTTVVERVMDGSSPTTDRLYRNDSDSLGNIKFTNVSNEAGILAEGFGLSVAILDVNQDNYPDVYVANDFILNDVLYVNNGDGTFTNQITDYFQHQSFSSMGSDVADINGDGAMDLMTLDMLPETNERYKQMFSAQNYQFFDRLEQFDYEMQYARNCLQINQGERGFSEIGQVLGVDATDWSWSVLFEDYDNDGRKDMFISNGFPRDLTDKDFTDFNQGANKFLEDKEKLKLIPIVKIRNYVYQNTTDTVVENGHLQFKDVSEKWGIALPSFSNGAAYADLDNDGDLDLVTNNINDPAFLYENTTNEQFENRNYLKIRFEGQAKNKDGLGVKLTLKTGERIDYREHNPYRGYLSSVSSTIHIGLGAATIIDSLLVTWTDGRQELLSKVSTNQTLTVDYKNAKETGLRLSYSSEKPLFQDISTDLSLSYQHHDPKFLDFRIQGLLPHIHSEEGPSLTVGDINQDGLDDFFVGNGRYQGGMFLIQQSDGTFDSLTLNKNEQQEDTGTLLFDADKDGDLDLYIASGSSEFKAYAGNFQDRLYINDNGNFKYIPDALPQITISSSTVQAADYDKDGDLDLFVGGRLIPQQYPMPERSMLLENQGGKFKDVTKKVGKDLVRLGLVTDAVWVDVDGDSWQDLIVVGEWMPITYFKNEKGILKRTENKAFEQSEGWWRSIVADDFDGDGDIDFIVGNQGINNKFTVSKANPAYCYIADFDNNGTIDPIISVYQDGAYYPHHLKKDLVNQLPHLRKRYLKYKDYATAQTVNIFSKEVLLEAKKLKACIFESVYIENKGKEKFAMHTLPLEMQYAPINDMLVDDFDGDGDKDILAIGNDYGAEVFSGRRDAFLGLLLKGDGKGNFKPLSIRESGFMVKGNARRLIQLKNANGERLIVASQNRDRLLIFKEVGSR